MNMIKKDDILPIIRKILLEETSKVKRNDYNKIQYKMDELEIQIIETIKELRKFEDSIPDGLKTISNGRVKTISENLLNAQNTLKTLKSKIREHKKNTYQQKMEVKK